MDGGVERLVDIYLEHFGLKCIEGEHGRGDLFYPYLLMDLQYGIYQSEIMPLKVKHEMKRARSRWREAYGLFNRRFFSAFTVEQQDAVVDLMDGYGRWMEGVLMVARVAVMNAIGDREFEEQKLLSACLLCNCLAQCAQIVYGTIFRDGRGEARTDVARASKEFADAYLREKGDPSRIDLNKVEAVNEAMRGVCARLATFPALKKV